MGAKGLLPGSIALRLAAAGWDIGLTTATPDAEEAFELRHLARNVTEMGRRCVIESVDLSLGTNVQIAMRQVAKALGRIDLLVVAPDLQIDKPSERLTDADWARVIGVNLSGVFYACRAVAREMRGQQQTISNRQQEGERLRGRIVVVMTAPADGANAAYRAAKAGVEGLARGLRDEWAEGGIAVHLLVLPADADEATLARAGVLVTEVVQEAEAGELILETGRNDPSA
jgi:NAD(P)-dependent dehydrogenase (short-subunit alcohol dehydrogenase family)